jgi:tetratricopeptide (TPR) repeat protein
LTTYLILIKIKMVRRKVKKIIVRVKIKRVFFTFLMLLFTFCGCAGFKLHQRGLSYLNAGDYPHAIMFLKEAVEENPKNVKYYRDYADAVIRYAEHTISKANGSFNTLPEIKKISEELKSVKKALNELSEMNSRVKDNKEEMRNEIENVNEELERIRKSYSDVRKKLGLTAKKIRIEADNHYKTALSFMDKLDADGTEKEISFSLQLNPWHKKALRVKRYLPVLKDGINAEKKLNPEKALKRYEKIAREFPQLNGIKEHINSIKNLLAENEKMHKEALSLYNKGRFKEAKDIYKKILSKNRYDKSAYKRLKLCSFLLESNAPEKIKDIDESITKAEAFIKDFPKDPHLSLAMNRLQREKAKRTLEDLIKEANRTLESKQFSKTADVLAKANEIDNKYKFNNQKLKAVREKAFNSVTQEASSLFSQSRLEEAYNTAKEAEKILPSGSSVVAKLVKMIQNKKYKDVIERANVATSEGRLSEGAKLFYQLEGVGFSKDEIKKEISKYLTRAAKETINLANSYREKGYPGIALHILYKAAPDLLHEEPFHSKISELYTELRDQKPIRVAMQFSGNEYGFPNLPNILRKALVVSQPAKKGYLTMVAPKVVENFYNKYGIISPENIQNFPSEEDVVDVIISVYIEGTPGQFYSNLVDTRSEEYIEGYRKVTVPNPECSQAQRSAARRTGDAVGDAIAEKVGGLGGALVGALVGTLTESAISCEEYITKDEPVKGYCNYQIYELVSYAGVKLNIGVADAGYRVFPFIEAIEEEEKSRGKEIRPIEGNCSKAGIYADKTPPEPPGRVEQRVLATVEKKFSSFIERIFDRAEYFSQLGKILSEDGRVAEAIEAYARASAYSEEGEREKYLLRLAELPRPSLDKLPSSTKRRGGRIMVPFEEALVVVTDLTPRGVNPQIAKNLTEVLRAHLVNSSNLRILAREEIDKIIKEYEFQVSELCGEECGTKIGLAAGAQKLVTGTISKIGKKYSITLKFLDIGSMQTQAAVSDTFVGNDEQLPAFIERLGDRLLNRLQQ